MNITIDERKGEVVISGDGTVVIDTIPRKPWQFWKRRIKIRAQDDRPISLSAAGKKKFKFGGGKFGGGGATGGW